MKCLGIEQMQDTIASEWLAVNRSSQCRRSLHPGNTYTCALEAPRQRRELGDNDPGKAAMSTDTCSIAVMGECHIQVSRSTMTIY